MNIFNILAGLASIFSLAYAFYQGSKMTKIKETRYRETWKLIKDVRSLMGKTKKLSDEKTDKGAHEISKSIYRELIKNAIALENNFNESTIEQWVKDDKIGNTDWQRGIAKSLLNRN